MLTWAVMGSMEHSLSTSSIELSDGESFETTIRKGKYGVVDGSSGGLRVGSGKPYYCF